MNLSTARLFTGFLAFSLLGACGLREDEPTAPSAAPSGPSLTGDRARDAGAAVEIVLEGIGAETRLAGLHLQLSVDTGGSPEEVRSRGEGTSACGVVLVDGEPRMRFFGDRVRVTCEPGDPSSLVITPLDDV